MTERVRESWTAWKRLSMARKIRLFGYAVLLIAVIELVVVAVFFDFLRGFWQGFLVNAGTDLIAVAITVLILNALQERAQEEQLKRQLIREMGSAIRDVAVPATEELRARGWLEDGSLQGSNLWGANLQGTYLRGANLRGANLVGADLQGANLWEADLQGANLRAANLRRTKLDKADLQGANLWGADLQEAYLSKANLQGANLRAANLQEANLLRANLQEANLLRANLQEANLEGADLLGADLREANLKEAYLWEANLKGAIYNYKTNWPDGLDPIAAGTVNVDEQIEPEADTEEQEDG